MKIWISHSSNSYSCLTANSHALSSTLECSHKVWVCWRLWWELTRVLHVCWATLPTPIYSFDHACERWTNLSSKCAHSTLIQLLCLFDSKCFSPKIRLLILYSMTWDKVKLIILSSLKMIPDNHRPDYCRDFSRNRDNVMISDEITDSLVSQLQK